eukprot:GEMP01025260.1.p1 GENE.GEMP01025260.1~~GEMP01025260.1.p1  ORF type:complete len:379 (+),score=83.03 GEMP01025260.1:203-1339(+)
MYGFQSQQSALTTSSMNLDPLFAQIAFYQDAHRLRQDVLNLLQVQRALRPKVDTFEGQGNQRVTLFYLHGTLPIVFGGNTYNIPMTIYFDPPYPAQPPRCFVSPTADMQIKPRHKHVDAKGMVFLPYLNKWNSQGSTCTELIAQITQVFSHDPPVYSCPGARPQQPQPIQPQKAQPQMAQPQMAQPQMAQPVQKAVIRGQVVSTSASVAETKKDKSIKSLTMKAQLRIPAILQPIIDEINEQLTAQDKLVAHKAEVDSLITGLQAEDAKIDRFNQELDDAKIKTTAFLEQHSNQVEFDVMAFLEPNDPLSRQLLDLIAEDLAYDDFLIFLEDNLQNKRVPPDRFVEMIRDTCKKTFYCKELKKKVISTIRARQMPTHS